MKKHKQEQRAVEEIEHNAFLIYWLCKIFIYSKSLAMITEFSYYISTIMSGRLMNLGALFFSSLYEGLKLWIDQLKAKQNKTIADPIWFLFMDKQLFSRIILRLWSHSCIS